MAEYQMTQGFGQFITNLPSAQSLKSLPIQGFCLYDVGQSLKLAPENGILLPIRATEPRKVNIIRLSGACCYNFYESLSGIETKPEAKIMYQLKLQFLRIPIRD